MENLIDRRQYANFLQLQGITYFPFPLELYVEKRKSFQPKILPSGHMANVCNRVSMFYQPKLRCRFTIINQWVIYNSRQRPYRLLRETC